MSNGEGEEETLHHTHEDVREESENERNSRIIRTLSASLFGILAGVMSFISESIGLEEGKSTTFLTIMILFIVIVVQKHLFRLIGINTRLLKAKDWVYQGFMTFGFWIMSWTIMLNSL